MVLNGLVVEKDSGEVQKADDIIAKLPKEQLKSLFYLFAGKPDSRIKVFNTPIFIGPEDISELNDCVSRKLRTHKVDAQVTSLVVGYKGANIHEFGTWQEFKEYHWQDPELVEEVVVKWDFMLSVESYQIPQRHTLLVRISADMKPGKFLQLMASGNSDEFEQMDVLTAPAFCRVDFINAQISKELINEVSDWYCGRKQPALISDFYYWFKKRRQRIAEFIHHSVPFMFSIFWISLFLWLVQNKSDGVIGVEYVAVWVFFGVYVLSPAHKVGHMLASRIYADLDEMEGSRVVFEFTSGDRKKISEITSENGKQGRKFIRKTLWSLALNVVAGVVATYLYLHS